MRRLGTWNIGRPAILLALAAIAPLALYAAFNTYVAYDEREAGLSEQMIDDAHSLSDGVDREIQSGLDEAETLAEAPALDPGGDRAIWEQVVRRIRARHGDWLTVALLAPDGRWLYSTEEGVAPNHTVEDRPSLERAVRTRAATVGDVVKGKRGNWGIPLRAPVIHDGKVSAVVTVVLKPQVIRERLANLSLPKPWIAISVNSYGHIVARTVDQGRTVGQRLNAQALAARAHGGGGTYQGKTFDGVVTQSAYWVSPVTGWSVHIGVPRSVYEAPMRHLLATILAGFAICLFLALALIILWIRDFEGRRRQALAVEQATRIDALGRLTGGVAHDFNNLLTVIQGNTEILGRRLKDNPQAERLLSSIRMASDRAAKLTRQLLVFARGGPAEPARVDLARKVEDLMGPLSQLVGGGIAIALEIEPDLPAVSVDPLQLEAALLNLAANARDAMNGRGRIEIRLRRSGPWVMLAVRDEGPGFDPAVLARVFDPFFTTKPVGQGTGLGLSQVYGLVKGAGGEVEAANAPGGGGLVTMVFPPLEEEAPPAALAPSQNAPPQTITTPAGAGAVLLVDDNDAVRATTAAYLREYGLTVVEAADAVQALQALESGGAVEVVVSDIIMPGELDGIALAAVVKARWPGLPILLVSGYSERAAEAQARGLPVLNKPYSLPDLERRLRAIIDRAEAAGASLDARG